MASDGGADDAIGGEDDVNGDDDTLTRGTDNGRHLSAVRVQEPPVVARHAAKLDGPFGQSSNLDSTDKDIVQWSATHLNFKQAEVQCMQRCSILGTEAQGKGLQKTGSEEDTGGRGRNAYEESFHKNGKL